MKDFNKKEKILFAILGLAFCTAWSWGTFQEGYLFVRFPALLSMSPEWAFFFFPLFNMIFFMIMAKYSYIFNRFTFSNILWFFSVLIIFILIPRASSKWKIWMDMGSLIIAGAAFAVFNSGWMWLQTDLPPEKIIIVFASAAMVASIILSIHICLDPVFLLILAGGFPFISALLWKLSSLINCSSIDYQQLPTKVKGLTPFPLKLAMRFFMFFLACSIFHHYVLSRHVAQGIAHFQLTELTYGVGAIAATLIYCRSKKKDLRYIYAVSLVAIGSGFLMISPFNELNQWINTFSVILLQFGFGCFGTYSWAIVVYTASQSSREYSFSILCKGLAIIACSVFVGQSLVFILKHISSIFSVSDSYFLGTAGVFSLLLAVLFFQGTPETFSFPDLNSPKEKNEFKALSEDEKILLLLLPYDLTKQETKIAVMLIKNLKNSEICSALNISDNTLRTHLKNIYRKTKTSGREDLRKLISQDKANPR